MIFFWIAAALLSAAAAALVLHFSAREPQAADADPTAKVYRRQLDEIDEMADRGLLGQDERRAAHAEAARRLLGAKPAAPETGATGAVRLWVITGALAACLGAVAVYFVVGSPGAADQPFSRRVAEWETANPETLNPEQLAVRLKTIVAERPGQVEPLKMLAQAQMASGQPWLAARNLEKALALEPNRPDLWANLGEARVRNNDKGEITPAAQAAFQRAIELDPEAIGPRYYLGQAKVDAGDVAGGVTLWRAIAEGMPAGDPRRAVIDGEIARVQGQAAATTSVPPEVLAMVQRLAERLKQNPDDPEGWARLVRSYTVLGDRAALDAALAQARRQFAGRPADLAAIEAAAKTPR